MTAGKFLVRWLVVFVLSDGLGFLIHAVLLRPTYETLMHDAGTAGLMRNDGDASSHMLWLQLAYVLFAAAVVWMYAKGNTGAGWLGQGIRFGLALWVVSSVYRYLVYFFVQPWPGMVIAKQIGFELPLGLLIGIVLAALSKNDAAAAKSS